MATILERMRKAREHWVEIGEGKAVCLLRPRFEDLRLFRGEIPSALAAEFAVGWRGVREADLVPSGGDIEVPFDTAILREWLADQPDASLKLSEWLLQAARERTQALKDAEKN